MNFNQLKSKMIYKETLMKKKNHNKYKKRTM